MEYGKSHSVVIDRGQGVVTAMLSAPSRDLRVAEIVLMMVVVKFAPWGEQQEWE